MFRGIPAIFMDKNIRKLVISKLVKNITDFDNLWA